MVSFSLILLLVPLSVDGARMRRTEGSAGKVSHLYSFGAPHPSNPMLTRKDGGCFAGYRVTAFANEFVDDEDIVPTLLTFTSYNHPNIQTLVVQKKDKDAYRTTWECGKNPMRFTNPKVSLHDKGGYVKLMAMLGSNFSRAKEAAFVGLDSSYEDSKSAKDIVERHGWNLVATATSEEDVSHLMQDPSTLRCLLTFEGSDSFKDFVTDAAIRRVSFCGLPQKVHVGFRNELRRMVVSSSFQKNIRSKLGKCTSVDATGHSLGGAVATLFTACVDSQNGSQDYKTMSWTMETPELLSAE